MLGVIVNSIAIVIGGIIGLGFKRGISEEYEKIILNGIAASVTLIGITGTVNGLSDDRANPMLFILALVIGGGIGQFINIDKKLEELGDFLETKFSKSEKSFSKAFVTSSLIYCVGTMAILGAISSGVNNDHSIYYTKSILDGVTSIILAGTLGVGVVFSAFIVFVYEGSLVMISIWLERYFSELMLLEISIVGGIMISMLGLNVLGLTKFKVANYLPALLVVVGYFLGIEVIS